MEVTLEKANQSSRHPVDIPAAMDRIRQFEKMLLELPTKLAGLKPREQEDCVETVRGHFRRVLNEQISLWDQEGIVWRDAEASKKKKADSAKGGRASGQKNLSRDAAMLGLHDDLVSKGQPKMKAYQEVAATFKVSPDAARQGIAKAREDKRSVTR